ncbi:anhydro-N-acetylmuramic acid kinase [Streptomyces kroppenstedtii]|uniref:anhydro-N-acetylmuramic acid kinase n=1 Tax=Streptomyces kroppenstedtii TaxID=3051181 RepID=UPI0028D1F93D|nr:anhydro-N-acetylmuramic acid kinase [Streptomyces sp. DSM 40484]
MVAGSVGNFIEWYEFGVHGYFATVIAARFFTPEGGSEAEALVRTYASFALAFFFRPVGAALFGRLGDRGGRRPVLIVVWPRGRPGTPVALNLGGIANLTAPDGTAFGTGPAGALIDAAVRRSTGRDFDAEGAPAARGIVREPLLRRLLDEPYCARPAPKTTGKELFHEGCPLAAPADFASSAHGDAALSDEDVIATLTRLTARTVADAVRSLSATGSSRGTGSPPVTEVTVPGGGTRNPVLMAMLREELRGVPLRLSDGLGQPAAAKEAYAFAVPGFLTVHGLAGTDPRSTGARHARILGSLTPGRSGFPADPRRRATAGAPGAEVTGNGVLSYGFHPHLIRWAHDAGDSPRLVSRPRADK